MVLEPNSYNNFFTYQLNRTIFKLFAMFLYIDTFFYNIISIIYIQLYFNNNWFINNRIALL